MAQSPEPSDLPEKELAAIGKDLQLLIDNGLVELTPKGKYCLTPLGRQYAKHKGIV